ncbi:hypothetical protein [Gaopeijia maritima]|uniref:LTD domain-containing protein n=1 Tax=Gaopeijia maritima TaxID=3119007 RepID=A0ABU9E5K5_9BACT
MLAPLLLLACSRGDVLLVDPEGVETPPNELTVRLVLDPELGLTPADFGWDDGVPDAEVTLIRVRDREEIVFRNGTTDGSGNRSFTGLGGGIEWVTVERSLSEAEATAPGPEWPVAMLTGAAKARAEPGAEVEITLRPPAPGGLVISEVALQLPQPFEHAGQAYTAAYIEIYNNGTASEFLDGMLIGKLYRTYHDVSRLGNRPCWQTEPMRVDPAGAWTDRILRFPGTGGDYPLEPGQAVIVAVSSADHRYIHPAMHDLTGADFEVLPRTLALADNPAVPNLEDVGPEPFVHNLFFSNDAQWFLAKPTDLGGLPRIPDPADIKEVPWEFVRIPSDQVLDATHIWLDTYGAYTQVGALPICLDPINPGFDQIPGGFADGRDIPNAAQRRVVGTRDGRATLLDTDVSAIDFVMSPTSPGQVPAESGSGGD